MPKKLIMVMGVQRSGTTALYRAFAADEALTSYPESADSPIYQNYALRPEPEIRSILNDAPGAVLLKPISETMHRDVADVFDEYADYDVRVVWIYRDPVNVLYSYHRQGWVDLRGAMSTHACELWAKRNLSVLACLERYGDRIAVVKHEDLIADAGVFRNLCAWADVKGSYLWRRDYDHGRHSLTPDTQKRVDSATRNVLSRLDEARSFKAAWLRTASHRVTSVLRVERLRSWSRRAQSAVTVKRSEVEHTRNPSSVEGLYFWLAPGGVGPSVENGEGFRWDDVGPRRVPQSANGATVTRSGKVNGQPVMTFTHGRAPEAADILEYGAPSDWTFMHDGSPFTLVVAIRPDARNNTKHFRWTIPIQVGARGRGGPAFTLSWDRDHGDVIACIAPTVAEDEASLASTVAYAYSDENSLFIDRWQVVVCTHDREANADSPLTLYMGAAQSCNGSKNKHVSYTASPAPGGTLQLGCLHDEADMRFYGDIAELLIFDRGLSDGERLGLTRYLKEKYAI